MDALLEHVRIGSREQHVLVMIGLDSKKAHVREALEGLGRQNTRVGAITHGVHDAPIRTSEKIKTHAHRLADIVRGREGAYLNVWSGINMNRTRLIDKGKGDV